MSDDLARLMIVADELEAEMVPLSSTHGIDSMQRYTNFGAAGLDLARELGESD